MDLTNLFLIALTILAIVTAFVEVLKKTFKIKSRFLPATSLVTGIFVALIFWPLTEFGVYYMIVVGLIAGLAASGTFDLLKATTKKGDK